MVICELQPIDLYSSAVPKILKAYFVGTISFSTSIYISNVLSLAYSRTSDLNAILSNINGL